MEHLGLSQDCVVLVGGDTTPISSPIPLHFSMRLPAQKLMPGNVFTSVMIKGMYKPVKLLACLLLWLPTATATSILPLPHGKRTQWSTRLAKFILLSKSGLPHTYKNLLK